MDLEEPWACQGAEGTGLAGHWNGASPSSLDSIVIHWSSMLFCGTSRDQVRRIFSPSTSRVALATFERAGPLISTETRHT